MQNTTTLLVQRIRLGGNIFVTLALETQQEGGLWIASEEGLESEMEFNFFRKIG